MSQGSVLKELHGYKSLWCSVILQAVLDYTKYEDQDALNFLLDYETKRIAEWIDVDYNKVMIAINR